MTTRPAARITILQGPVELILRHPAMAHPVEADSVHTLRTRPGFAVPWEGARRLLAQLRMEMGDAPIHHALAPCRGLLSLVLRELDESLTRQQRRHRDQHSALHLASLPLIEPSPRMLASRSRVAAGFDSTEMTRSNCLARGIENNPTPPNKSRARRPFS